MENHKSSKEQPPSKPSPAGEGSGKRDRREKLARALRRNLLRRKNTPATGDKDR